MYLCYVDESGGFEAPDSSPSATPLMVVSGLIVKADAVEPLTTGLLTLKNKFYPALKSNYLDLILDEVKGSTLRAKVRAGPQRERHRALSVLDETLRLIEAHRVRLVGRVWVKEPMQGLRPRDYDFSIQDISRHFNEFLRVRRSRGFVFCDGRLRYQDSQVAHSVFVKKYQPAGDAFPQIVESVMFGGSGNHAGLQLADIVTSGLLFPIAARAYCADTNTVHAHPRFDVLRVRYAKRVQALQYRYRGAGGRKRGGMVVADKLGWKPSEALFDVPKLDDV